MKDVLQPLNRRTLGRQQPIRLSRIVIDFAVPPTQVITWRAPSDAALTVRHARIWLTRAGSNYDFWLSPDAPALKIKRGERIWLSTDALVSAEVSLSMANLGVMQSSIQLLMQIGARMFVPSR